MKLIVEKKLKTELTELLSDDNIYVYEAKKRFGLFFLKNFFRIIRNFIKRPRAADGMLGGGIPNNIETYLNIGSVAAWVASGLAWDLIKLSLVKIHSKIKTRNRYIEIIDEFYEPGSCHKVKFIIPINLNKDELDIILAEAEEISNSFKKIRFYFHSKQIIFKRKKFWKIKIKSMF